MLNLLTSPIVTVLLLLILAALVIWWLVFMKRDWARTWRDYFDFRLLLMLIFGAIILIGRACGADL